MKKFRGDDDSYDNDMPSNAHEMQGGDGPVGGGGPGGPGGPGGVQGFGPHGG